MVSRDDRFLTVNDRQGERGGNGEHPSKMCFQPGDLISVFAGKVLAGERLQRRQDGTNETVTPER